MMMMMMMTCLTSLLCLVSIGTRSPETRNVPFTINGGDEALEKKFLDEAKKHKLYTLAGHRSVGGCRASLYNGLPVEGVAKLTDFMKSFMDENRKWGFGDVPMCCIQWILGHWAPGIVFSGSWVIWKITWASFARPTRQLALRFRPHFE